MGKHGGGALSSGFSSSSHHGHSSFGSSHHSHHHGHHHHHSGHSTVIIGNWGSYRRRPHCCFGGFCCIGFLVFIICAGVFSPRTQDKHLSLTQFESVLVNPTTKWTSQVDVYSTYGDSVTSYLLSHVPNLVSLPSFYEYQSLSVSPLQFEYYGYRMNRGSQISASWSLGTNAYFYFIKGEDNLEKFKNGEITALKTLYGTSGTYTFSSTDDDDYYFVWSNTNSYASVMGSVSLTLTLTKYDTTSYLSRCTDSACYFHLASGTSQCVVIEAGQNNQANDVFDVSYRTHGRVDNYWIIFGPVAGVFFVFVVAIIIVLACVARRKNSYSQISETTAFVPPPSNYGAPVIPPPTGYAPQAAPYAPYSPYATAPPTYAPQPPGYMPPPVDNSYHV